jgi:hypothetical protein
MTTHQMAPENPVWGAPDPEPRRWGMRETATAVGVAAVIAGLGGAAIYAATGSDSPQMGAPHHAAAPGTMPGGPPGIGAHGPGTDSAPPLHGEFVTPDGSGGYTTVLTQTGTVTAISSTSITVRSDDGYTQAYVVPSGPGSATPPFAVDDPVTIRATRTADTATLTNISNPPPQN